MKMKMVCLFTSLSKHNVLPTAIVIFSPFLLSYPSLFSCLLFPLLIHVLPLIVRLSSPPLFYIIFHH